MACGQPCDTRTQTGTVRGPAFACFVLLLSVVAEECCSSGVGLSLCLVWCADMIDIGELQSALRGMGIMFTIPDTKLLMNSLGVPVVVQGGVPMVSQVRFWCSGEVGVDPETLMCKVLFLDCLSSLGYPW